MQEADLIGSIEALTPFVEQHAADAQRERKPVDAVMDAIEATGAYRYFVPKRFGGFEFSVEGFARIGMSLGEACLSTAWVTTFCMEHNWILAQFNREAQEEIFGGQPYIIAPGMLAPTGMAAPEDGGFRLSGRWEWGTGIMHADWVLVGAVTAGSDPERPDVCMYVVPRGKVAVLDTWNTAGMVGTGSNDVQIEDVFVPAHRRLSMTAVRDGATPGAGWLDTALYRMPMLPFLALTAAAPAVGAARKAVRLFRERVAERMLFGTRGKQDARPVTQACLGRVAARMANAETQLMALGAEVAASGTPEEPIPLVERGALRVRIGLVVREVREIVTEVLEASGAHAQFLDNPLQRIQRDLNTLSGHTIFDLDVGTEVYGRLLLGHSANGPI